MIKKILILFILFGNLQAQTVFEPVNKDIYGFLHKLSSKGIIDFHDLIKPLPRKYLAEKLIEAESKIDQLNYLEKEELKFFKKDYFFEFNYTNQNEEEYSVFFDEDPGNRFRFFSYSDDLLKMNLSLLIGFESGTIGDKYFYHLQNGISSYGYLNDHIGFKFNFWDNREQGSTINKRKVFSSETGIVANSEGEKFIEYANLNAVISVDWSWGDFSAGQDFINWGFGKSGNLVLSNRSPAFPFIRLNLYLNDWLRFNYFHAKLNSDIIDSSKAYRVPLEILSERYLFREKYFVTHTLMISPANGLEVSVGESMVYSDRFEPVYLVPIIFFKTADHYLSNYDPRAGDNSQFFLNVSSKNQLKNTHLFGTLFIDEISISKIFSSEHKNQFGFTFGFSAFDIIKENLIFHSEYTRILPFVYKNFIPAQDYTNHNYFLGHWIGNNADIVYSEFEYLFSRKVSAKLWGEYIRKGAEGTLEQQYSAEQPEFLFGDKLYLTKIGLNIKLIPIHETILEINAVYNKSSENFDNYNVSGNKFWELSGKVSYGL